MNPIRAFVFAGIAAGLAAALSPHTAAAQGGQAGPPRNCATTH